jgi:glycosyltransferase involved in cell wall biosynthesis
LEITHIGKLDEAAQSEKVNKRRLAVVTTYDELCGIAGFSRCLVRALEPHFDLQVFDLDQFLLRQTDKRGRQKADRHFKSICRQLETFDVVNLQLEFGTLGATEGDIFRRLRWLCDAARELSVTFHTVPRRDPMQWQHFWYHMRRLKIGKALEVANADGRSVAKRTYAILRKYARTRKLSLIVHTRRDRRYLQVIQDFEHVYDHPLSFLQLEDVSRILEETKRNPFGSIVEVPKNHKAIGVFGFLSAYKGFETPIRALRHLPEDHHLYIFGGVHPNDIPLRRTASYVRKLMKEVSADYTLMDRLLGLPPEDTDLSDLLERGDAKEPEARMPIQLSLESVAHALDLVKGQPDSLVNRVHFIGALSDEEFYTAIASCDVVVLPYQEVMQSSSGPASLSIELGKRTLLSRTRGFLQLGKYFPGRLEYFDVGNHLQLVSMIRQSPAAQPYPERPVSMETLCQMYVGIHSGGEHQLADGEDEAVHELAAVHAAGNGASSSRPASAVLPMDAVGLKAAGDPTGVDAARQLRRYLRKTLPGSAPSKATSDDKPAPN